MNLDALVTAAEFRRYLALAGGAVSLAAISMWRTRGRIEVHGHRGNSPLYRLGDLLDVEADTRHRVARSGGKQRAA
jgi:hypothetical protein